MPCRKPLNSPKGLLASLFAVSSPLLDPSFIFDQAFDLSTSLFRPLRVLKPDFCLSFLKGQFKQAQGFSVLPFTSHWGLQARKQVSKNPAPTAPKQGFRRRGHGAGLTKLKSLGKKKPEVKGEKKNLDPYQKKKNQAFSPFKPAFLKAGPLEKRPKGGFFPPQFRFF